jgi:hypothetical protein
MPTLLLARYDGWQPGFKTVAGFHIWTLLEDMRGPDGQVTHPVNSTVSENTIKREGYAVANHTAAMCGG